MKTKMGSLVAIAFFLFSCSNRPNEQTKEQIVIATPEDQQNDTEFQIIELNNGEKWKVDENMVVHIRNMENDVVSFSSVDQKAYKALSKKLQLSIDLLTSNCTMKGKAHDELHKWLLPYIDLVSELAEAKNEAEAKKQFENIQISFKTFNQYFQ